MSLFVRIIFFGLTGIIAGSFAWPFAELLLHYQSKLPSLLLFSMLLGITIGIFIGGCFGTSEGIITVSGKKARAGALMGIIIGAVGGLIGFVTGQAALLLLGTTFFNSTSSFRNIGFPLSKALGWATFGICIGIVEGIRSRSGAKIKNGIIGGVIGGFIGGLVFEFIRVFSPGNYFSRLIGLIILGLMIGVFYGLIENRLSEAILRLLNGKYKGKEFPLAQKRSRIGKFERADINLSGYTDVSGEHAEIKKEKKRFILSDTNSKAGIFVNDSKTSNTALKNGDVIRIGSAQFLFSKR